MTGSPDAVPDLSVIVVSWNVRDHVLACIASIAADPDAPALEVILVDNASSDDTVAAVRGAYPWVHVIENSENAGFPRANNQALARARGRHVLYLNPDTEVRPGTLGECVRALDGSPDIGALGCRIEHADGRIQYEGARNRYRFRHLVYEVLYLHEFFPRSRVFGEHLIGHWDHRTDRDVEVLSGAFMMVPRELAIELGGLPDDLFMYHEDVAFCMQVARAGRRLRYHAGVSVIHHCGQSAARSDARLGLLEVEAKRRFIREVDGAVWAAASRAGFALRSVVRLALCVPGVLLPQRLKRRYPRVFDWRTHALQLVWACAPAATRTHMPGAVGQRATAGTMQEAA